jgi:ribonuclease R
VEGHKVVCQITDYGKGRRNPEGVITQILGHINDPGTDILSIVKSYDIPSEFSDEVIRYLDRIPDSVNSKDCEDAWTVEAGRW